MPELAGISYGSRNWQYDKARERQRSDTSSLRLPQRHNDDPMCRRREEHTPKSDGSNTHALLTLRGRTKQKVAGTWYIVHGHTLRVWYAPLCPIAHIPHVHRANGAINSPEFLFFFPATMRKPAHCFAPLTQIRRQPVFSLVLGPLWPLAPAEAQFSRNTHESVQIGTSPTMTSWVLGSNCDGARIACGVQRCYSLDAF